jgi:hypothetical protein
MTLTATAFALLASAPKSKVPFSSFLGSSPLKIPSTTIIRSSTCLAMAGPKLEDYSVEAIQFFTSIRVPSALVAGSSLGAFFIMTNRMSKPEQEKSKGQLAVMFLYHLFSLASLLLSLSVIVTSTSASNVLLISDINPMASSAYELLMREVKYEYLTTRWSFYAAIICFLKAVAFRALIEFNLMRKDRIRSALLVSFSMTGLISHVLHMVNDCLYTYPNFFQMTLGVGKVGSVSRVGYILLHPSCYCCCKFANYYLSDQMESFILSAYGRKIPRCYGSRVAHSWLRL